MQQCKQSAHRKPSGRGQLVESSTLGKNIPPLSELLNSRRNNRRRSSFETDIADVAALRGIKFNDFAHNMSVPIGNEKGEPGLGGVVCGWWRGVSGCDPAAAPTHLFFPQTTQRSGLREVSTLRATLSKR